MLRSRIERWNAAYAALKHYRKERPGEWPSWNYVAPDGLRLGLWCQNQRVFRKRRALTLDRVRKLESIGFPWKGVARAGSWEEAFAALKRFRRENPNHWPSTKERGGGVNLRRWCHQQREMKKKGKLSRDRARKLENIGFEWELYDAAWERGFEALKDWRRCRPDRWPRAIEILPDGFKLGSWCHKQRQRRKQGIVPRDRIRMLDAIDFEWEPEEALWNRAFWILRLYRRDNPDRWPPRSYVTAGGFRLGAWCQNKRTNMKRGVLSKDHVKQLKKIGFE
jgi:hypothetical protein